MPFTTNQLAMRGNRITIASTQGKIIAQLIHAMETILSTNDASIDLTLLPIITKHSTSSKIRTKSLHGDTRVQVLSPITIDQRHHPPFLFNSRPEHHTDLPVTNMKSRHEVGTRALGSLQLEYPPEWSGFVKGRVLNSSIDL
jgi:hypothetical protein